MFWLGDLKDFQKDFIINERDFSGHVADIYPGLLVFVTNGVEAEMIEGVLFKKREMSDDIFDFEVVLGFVLGRKEVDV
jgi:hypothetical protein